MRKPICILAVLLALLLTLPLTVSAEAGTPVPSSDVVYISSRGKDRNDGKTEDTAVKSLEAATASLPNGGTVVILDDTELDLSGVEVLKAAHRIYLSPAKQTIYIRGRKTADGKVPTLTLRADDNKAPCLELGGALAIDDLHILVSGTSNLWISANGNTFTAGANLSFTLQGNSSVRLTGGKQDVGASGAMEADAAPTLNIFGGEWGAIYGGSFAAQEAAQVGGVTTVNFFGGKVNEIATHRSSGTQKADAVINLWCGNVTKLSGGKFGENAAPTLNIYNGVLPTDSPVISDPFKVGEGGNVHELTGTAPGFDDVSFVARTESAPPETDTEPSSGENETPAATEPTPTKPATEANEKPATNEPGTGGASQPTSSGGCTSGIGSGIAGLLLFVFILPFLIRKQNRKGENQ